MLQLIILNEASALSVLMKCEYEWSRRFNLQITDFIRCWWGFIRPRHFFFFFFFTGSQKESPWRVFWLVARHVVAPTPAQLLQLFRSCYSLIIFFSLFRWIPHSPSYSVTLCLQCVVMVRWENFGGYTPKTTRTTDPRANRRNWTDRGGWFMWVGVCVCVLYKVHIDRKQICQWLAV